MPTNPLDLLKQTAMRHVPRPDADTRQKWDQRAVAKQSTDPGWKKVGRNALDFITSPLVDDPFADGAENRSWGSKAGMLAAAAPGIPKLPMIAPEAYQHVKAGGLKLYSRLTDTFAKAPAKMKPAKAISLAQSGASREEIELRKLGEFLKGRQPMVDVDREEIMGHLASNPLELDVVRKGEHAGRANYNLGGDNDPLIQVQRAFDDRQDEVRQFMHEMDTQYGANWEPQQLAPEQVAHYEDLIRRRDIAQEEHADVMQARAEGDFDAYPLDQSRPQYSFMQTPGPSENYGESLIKLPVKGKPSDVPDDVRAAFPAEQFGEDRSHGYINPDVFTSSHFSDDPNTLVWSRHNDRYLENDSSGIQDLPKDADGYPDLTVQPSKKGRFIEEIQSDWHQQGREKGYQGDPIPDPATIDDYEAVSRRVPDAPFKDTYHELALKQQLLDAAEDPSLEWLGVADAYTNATLEGHDPIRPGTDLWYDEKHPHALKKLLEPLGGKVGLDFLPAQGPVVEGQVMPNWPLDRESLGRMNRTDTIGVQNGQNRNGQGIWPIVQRVDVPPSPRQSPGLMKEIEMRQQNAPLPGPGMWKANLTPELKELIRQRGFPAMAALLALQAQRDKFSQGDQ